MKEETRKKAENAGAFLDSFVQHREKKEQESFSIKKARAIEIPLEESDFFDLESDLPIENDGEQQLIFQPIEEKLEIDNQPKSPPKSTTLSDSFSLEDLKPEARQIVEKILAVIPKEQVEELIVQVKNNKKVILDNKQQALGDLSEKDKTILMKKFDEWDVPTPISEMNATVILSWLDKIIAN